MKFNAIKVKDKCIQWIRDWFSKNGPNCNAVVGISGGKDSSVVAALCVEALGADRVIGVLMPNVKQDDIEYAYKLIDALGIQFTVCNIGKTVQALEDAINYKYSTLEVTINLSTQSKINLPARVRMATLYAVAQSINGRVANTCNLSEDWIGYSTRYGDSVGDFSPLSDLTTDEVVAIGEILGLPKELTHKIPSDGLCEKTDEDRFGFSYEVLNKYIRTGICEDEKIKQKIDNLHKKNMFKLLPMPKFDYAPN